MNLIAELPHALLTSLGFFWKAGWAFVLGYSVSAMIQAFVPRARLTRHMGGADLRSVGLSTLFGAISSSCSFAALATARSLVLKGANFVAAIAFMFASTNLVAKLRTRAGWLEVGRHFVMEWKMVYKEIIVGFIVAGLVKTLVPRTFWEALFLQGSDLPSWLIALENAAVAPFVAAATFIGSMGNIPLAAVLAAVLAGSGVAFAGVMGFIYSDLVVPPLVRVNARYYGWKMALVIAGIMYISVVSTALVLDLGFSLAGVLPHGARPEAVEPTFQVDYSFWLNLVFTGVAAAMLWLWWQDRQAGSESASR